MQEAGHAQEKHSGLWLKSGGLEVKMGRGEEGETDQAAAVTPFLSQPLEASPQSLSRVGGS